MNNHIQSFQYSSKELNNQILFQFKAFKRSFLKNQKYYINVLTNKVLICHKSNIATIKYTLNLNYENYLVWKLDNNNLIVGFEFYNSQKLILLHADINDLKQFKTLIQGKIIFKKIGDFYEPQMVIGKGGSAKVIEVLCKSDNIKYAAKIIEKQYLNKSEQGLAAFKQEIFILNKIQQSLEQNLTQFIKFYEIFEGEHTYYIIMDLIKGKNLQEELDINKIKKEKFTQEEVQIIMKKLIEGIVFLHSNNIMHRDIKPSNLMFSQQRQLETLKIIDFGLAHNTNSTILMFPKCGTPGYVAPEILNLKENQTKYDQSCDIFSCGCIFYKLLTGRSLFTGIDFNDVLKENKLCDINYKINSIKDISYESLGLLKLMLQKSAKDRIKSEVILQHPYLTAPVFSQNYLPQSFLRESDLSLTFNGQRSINLDQSSVSKQRVENTESPFLRRIKSREIQQQDQFFKILRIQESLKMIENQRLDTSADKIQQEEIDEFNQNQYSVIINSKKLPQITKPVFCTNPNSTVKLQIKQDIRQKASSTINRKNSNLDANFLIHQLSSISSFYFSDNAGVQKSNIVFKQKSIIIKKNSFNIDSDKNNSRNEQQFNK